jgi:nifR3 family TIM-barrel protein
MPERLNLRELLRANPLVMAPMCGITDHPFRVLVQEQGAGLTHPEMVSSAALARDSKKTRQLVDIRPGEGPVGVQLFGCQPEEMAEAARVVAGLGASMIGLNFGCPVPKVVTHNGGSALLKDPPLIGRIIEAVVMAVDLPVMPKIRSGWDAGTVNAVEVARVVEGAGAHALAVHGRTRSQKYTGQADWCVIAEVKRAVGIPVLGNGDLFEPEDAPRRLRESGADGLMIARGALGNPWLFSRSLALIQGRALPPAPSREQRVATLKRHVRMTVDERGPKSLLEMRKHAMWYLKGLPDSAELRNRINQAGEPGEVDALLDAYLTAHREAFAVAAVA